MNDLLTKINQTRNIKTKIEIFSLVALYVAHGHLVWDCLLLHNVPAVILTAGATPTGGSIHFTQS